MNKYETNVLQRLKTKYPDDWRKEALRLFVALMHEDGHPSLECFDLIKWLDGVVELAPDIHDTEQKEVN